MNVDVRAPTPQEQQLERLLEALRPGQAKERYAGWGREMRSLFGRLDAPVLRRAVTTYLALEDDLPTPHEFGEWVRLAERHLERARQVRTVRLAPPPPPSVQDVATAQARTDAAKAAARAALPERMRGRYVPPGRRL
jgi:hypothetical protein